MPTRVPEKSEVKQIGDRESTHECHNDFVWICLSKYLKNNNNYKKMAFLSSQITQRRIIVITL